MEFILLSNDSIHTRLLMILNCNVIVSIHSQSVIFWVGGGGIRGGGGADYILSVMCLCSSLVCVRSIVRCIQLRFTCLMLIITNN